MKADLLQSVLTAVDPESETSAYLQGEIGRQMFPAASIVICPKCRK